MHFDTTISRFGRPVKRREGEELEDGELEDEEEVIFIKHGSVLCILCNCNILCAPPTPLRLLAPSEYVSGACQARSLEFLRGVLVHNVSRWSGDSTTNGGIDTCLLTRC